MRPGDVLVLVRQRGALFEAIIRALKNEGMPVAGADRLVLTEHIAVMDLMALADALLLPQDDLALATVLKSPLFGLDRGRAVRARLGPQGQRCARRCAARSEPDHRGAARRAAREWARDMTPFAFYAELLGADGGRAAILRGSGTRPTTRSTNFSISRSTTSARDAVAARLRRLAAHGSGAR